MHDQADELRELVRRTSAATSNLAPTSPRLITVAGGKGGVGTTTIATNLGVALALSGRRVVLVDADLDGADCAALCQVESRLSIADILAGRHNVHEVLTRGPAGLLVLPGPWSPEEAITCSPGAQDRLLHELRGLGAHADFVLIDAGSGMNRTVARFCQAAEQLLIVTTPDPIAILDSYASIKVLHAGKPELPIYSVVNLADEQTALAVQARLDQVCQRFLGRSIAAVGHVPTDPRVAECRTYGGSLALQAPNAAATLQIERLAELLLRPASDRGKQPNAPHLLLGSTEEDLRQLSDSFSLR
ncbi:MAG: P-loop NTPase [Pirellulales bacterium]|nr:P-loop NTPase [Pirellulales bacterium]